MLSMIDTLIKNYIDIGWLITCRILLLEISSLEEKYGLKRDTSKERKIDNSGIFLYTWINNKSK